MKLNRLASAEQTIERDFKWSEKHTRKIYKSIINRKRYSRFLHILGPGLVTGAADDDPSGIATYSQAGATHGFGLLWAFPLVYPLLLAVQETCSRIGAISGKGLAANIKEHYNKKILYAAVALVVAANTLNIGADIGAMAATLQLLVPAPFGILAISLALVILLQIILIPYRQFAKILKWLALALFAYPITAFIVGQQWGEISRATFNMHPNLNFDMLYIFVGMLGTTISPYLFFWDTSQVVEEEISKHNIATIGEAPVATKKFLHNLRIDNFTGMTLASATAWFIVIVCGSVLFAQGTKEINSAADAARALEPLVQNFPNAGLLSKLIFSFGVIGLGLLAVPTLAGSASYAISETMGWKEGLYHKFKKAVSFYVVIIGATLVGLLMNFLGIDPIQALVFTAVFNGIAAIPLLFLIYRVGNNKNVMGDYKNGIFTNIGVGAACLLMTISGLFLLFAFATGRL